MSATRLRGHDLSTPELTAERTVDLRGYSKEPGRRGRLSPYQARTEALVRAGAAEYLQDIPTLANGGDLGAEQRFAETQLVPFFDQVIAKYQPDILPENMRGAMAAACEAHNFIQRDWEEDIAALRTELSGGRMAESECWAQVMAGQNENQARMDYVIGTALGINVDDVAA